MQLRHPYKTPEKVERLAYVLNTFGTRERVYRLATLLNAAVPALKEGGELPDSRELLNVISELDRGLTACEMYSRYLRGTKSHYWAQCSFMPGSRSFTKY